MSQLGLGGFMVIALAGSLGALGRYLLDIRISAGQHRRAQSGARVFPLGILAANTAACFLVGAAAAWAGGHGIGWAADSLAGIPGLLVIALILGIGGGLSTMSTFVVAVVSLWRSGARAMAGNYLAVTLGAGLAAGFLGGLVAVLLP
ncbi:CrcB family protein [Paeniglutamicibacter sp. ABSL32-1]|uniref:fluoride efflux transporter FluC n=1 Tax=Paeniglutamicibacter quisquiliarum TaxID=2849498 RepID=UPI001C2D14D3|nr:CrcB family protein [Paeniglutamicibacter quisquiliarum]MBV1779602.1 CrcB family protein [Paeniglutamicibacter quisquiliarum]